MALKQLGELRIFGKDVTMFGKFFELTEFFVFNRIRTKEIFIKETRDLKVVINGSE